MDDKPALPAPPTRPQGRGMWWLPVLVTGALAAAGYYGLQREAAFEARIASLAAELGALRAGQQHSGSGLAASRAAMDRLEQGQTATADALAALVTRTTTLENRLNTLPRADASAFDALALGEARALIGLAEQRLLLARDVAGATAALNLARSRLPAMQQALAVAIGQDLGQLAGFHDADLSGMAAELTALATASAGLPLRPTAAPTPEISPPSPATGWQGLGGRVWHDLRGLVEIRKLDEHPDPLLDPTGARHAAQRVGLALEAARLAVLARDTRARDAAFAEADAALRAAHDAAAPEVAAALAKLSALGQAELAPTLPALTAPAVADAAARAGAAP